MFFENTILAGIEAPTLGASFFLVIFIISLIVVLDMDRLLRLDNIHYFSVDEHGRHGVLLAHAPSPLGRVPK